MLQSRNKIKEIGKSDNWISKIYKTEKFNNWKIEKLKLKTELRIEVRIELKIEVRIEVRIEVGIELQ